MKDCHAKKYSILITLALLVLFAFPSTSFSEPLLKKGFPAPNFSLENIEKEVINLEDAKEKQKLSILYFYNGNEDSFLGLKEFSHYFENYNIEEKCKIFLINMQKDFKEQDKMRLEELWKNPDINFEVLLDYQNEVASLYNIEKTPTAILLDKNLIVKRVYSGLLSKQQKLMFRYMSYFLGAEKKIEEKKEKKENDDCDDGTCGPPDETA